MPRGPLPYEPQRGLAKAVRVLREQAKLSQSVLAERAGMSSSWLSRIESGSYDPTWSSMRKVAEGLGVSMETLAEIAGDYEERSPSAD